MSWLRLAGTVSCCALVLVFGLMLFPALPQETHAAPEVPLDPPSTGSSIGINIPSSIDFASVTPTPDVATTTATADLTVTTTNSASYSLYLYSSDGDNSLKPKISSLASISTINATAGDVGLTLSSLKPNTWGYNLGTEAPTDSTTYSAVPTDNSTPIQTKDTSDTNSANDTYTLSFGAKVDSTIASGAYSNALTVAVVAEPAFVTIAFDGNGADGGSMASLQMLPGAQQTLPSNTFTRSGYVFNGWNTSSNGSGTSYTDGASYTAPAGSAGQTITLYAQWQQIINQLDDVTYMQDLTASHCANSTEGVTATLIDRRDNNSYTIKKIKDSCWMVQNLRLASGTRLTSTYSNVASSYTMPTAQLAGNEILFNVGQMQMSTNTTYGGYYNFCAASAGTVCNENPVDAIYDICPKGWHLPSEDEASFFEEGTYSERNILYKAFGPTYSGSYYNSYDEPGDFGSGSSRYWVSTHDGSYGYQLTLAEVSFSGTGLSGMYVTDYSRDSGYHVRCILAQ